LDLAIENKKDLVIEFKHPVPTGGLVEKLTHNLLAEKSAAITKSKITVSLISFSYLATLRNLRSGHQSAYLIQSKILSKINPAPIIGPSIKLVRENPEFISTQIKKGKKVFVWTVNNEADLQLCARLGVNAVMSDNPARARKMLGYS
jgi:glycerophosphoryl diester phosphodiesterase